MALSRPVFDQIAPSRAQNLSAITIACWKGDLDSCTITAVTIIRYESIERLRAIIGSDFTNQFRHPVCMLVGAGRRD